MGTFNKEENFHAIGVVKHVAVEVGLHEAEGSYLSPR